MSGSPAGDDQWVGRSLGRLLEVEVLGGDSYLGQQPDESRSRIFGGQVIAQAVMSASRTVSPDRDLNALHSHFVTIGDATQPIAYDVERIRDGKSFSFRRVTARQGDTVLLVLLVSFHAPEYGAFSHQSGAAFGRSRFFPGRVPVSPDSIPKTPVSTFVDHPIDMREIVAPRWPLLNPPRKNAWCRSEEILADDPALHAAVAAYISDLMMMSAIVIRHNLSPWEDLALSLDHSMWFHRPVRADEWLFFDCRSPIAGRGRGFSLGRVYTRSGDHAISVAQEGLLRRAEPTA